MSQTILITGCSTGIGYCAAHELKDAGYQVIASARKAADVEKLKAEGFEHVLQLDLDDSECLKQAVAWIEEHIDRLDGVFHNGAYGQTGAVEDLPRDALRRQFETNLFGTHELNCLLMPIFRRQGHGRVILNSSVLGMVAMPYRGAYNASKFALEGLFDTLRLELRGTDIHVSLIEPGPILSKFRSNALVHFKANIDIEHSVHKAKYQKSLARLSDPDAPSKFTLPPEAVTRCVRHAMEQPRPKIRYYVTQPTHLMGVLRRILPYRLLDRVLASGGA